MCRQNTLRGLCCICLGVGMLIGCCIESGFWCCALGISGVIFGIILQKK
jgi:hypothetical protein